MQSYITAFLQCTAGVPISRVNTAIDRVLCEHLRRPAADVRASCDLPVAFTEQDRQGCVTHTCFEFDLIVFERYIVDKDLDARDDQQPKGNDQDEYEDCIRRFVVDVLFASDPNGTLRDHIREACDYADENMGLVKPQLYMKPFAREYELMRETCISRIMLQLLERIVGVKSKYIEHLKVQVAADVNKYLGDE